MATYLGTNGDDTLTGTNDDDVFIGQGGSDSINAGGGNDFISIDPTPSGSDEIDGGAGSDTVALDANFADGAFSYDAGTGELVLTFMSDSTTERMINVEQVVFNDQVVLVVGAGGYATIQDAVDAATGGELILVTESTTEQVVIDGKDNITIQGVGDVTITAPADVEQTGVSSTGRSVHAVITVLNADNVVVSGINVDGAGVGNTISGTNPNYYGVFYRNASGGLENVDVTGVREPYAGGMTLSGNQRGVGVVVDNDAPAMGDPLLSFFMTGGTIDDFQKNATAFTYADLDVSGVTVTGGGAQSIIAQNGFQAINCTGMITGNTITGIGYSGASNFTASAILTYSTTDLVITDNIITGSDAEDPASKVVAIYVIGQFFGDVSGGEISGNTISQVDNGVVVFGDIEPDAVLIENNSVTDLDPTADGAGVYFEPNPALTTAFDVDGTDQTDFLAGAAGADSLTALGGDDLVSGGGGNDTLEGGDGDDTATYSGNRADYTVTAVTDMDGRVTGFTQVVDNNAGDGDEGTDSLSGVEAVEFADGGFDAADPVQLFDENGDFVGTYDTIQEAVDAADTDYTISLGATTYSENVVIDVDGLTINALPGAALEGTFLSDNNVTGPLNEWLKTQSAYDGSAGAGMTISADNVTINGLTIRAFTQGLVLRDGSDFTSLDGVVFESNFTGIHKPTTALVTNFEMLGGSIGDGHIGMDITAAMTGSSFDVVLIDGVAFLDLNRKGIYAESLSNATITNFTMTNVGEFGGIVATGALGAGGNGVNLNLKYGDYANILISNFIMTNVGSSNRDGAGAFHQNGGAIVIAARDDAPSYSGDPASLINVTVENGSIDGTSTGIQVGEPGKDNATPDLTVDNVTIDNAQHSAQHGDVGNQSQGVMTLTGTANDDSYIASGNSDGQFDMEGAGGNDTLTGGSDNDTLEGGANDDALNGAGGTDIAQVGMNAVIARSGGGWTVTSTDGTDTLSDIEVVEADGGARTLLVGNGGFATIQEAVDASSDGDTILIAEGNYTEQVTIDGRENLTIKGVGNVTITAPANLGINGSSDYFGDNVRSVVGVNDSTNIDIRNVTVDGAYAGDTTAGSNGDELSGIAYLNSSGDVVDVTIRRVSNSQGGGLFGLQHGSGFFVDNSGLTSGNQVSFTNGSISDFQKTGALLIGADVTFAGNAITGVGPTGLTAQNGIQIALSEGSIDGNVISAIGYTVPSGGTYFYASGIIAYEPGGPLSIDGNTITGVGGAGEFTALDLSDTLGINVAFTNNFIASATNGIIAYTYTGGTVGLDADPDFSGNIFANIGDTGIYFDPEDSVLAPFQTTEDFSVTGTNFRDRLAGSLGDDSFNGGGAADVLLGRDGSDSLAGGAGKDEINGGSGDDTLIGEVGRDFVKGSGGADQFTLTSTNKFDADNVRDFVSGTDTIGLDSNAFGLPEGAIDPSIFVVSNRAQDADDRLIYNQAKGKLFYDADGDGAQVQVLIATFNGLPTITASDFTVI